MAFVSRRKQKRYRTTHISNLLKSSFKNFVSKTTAAAKFILESSSNPPVNQPPKCKKITETKQINGNVQFLWDRTIFGRKISKNSIITFTKFSVFKQKHGNKTESQQIQFIFSLLFPNQCIWRFVVDNKINSLNRRQQKWKLWFQRNRKPC